MNKDRWLLLSVVLLGAALVGLLGFDMHHYTPAKLQWLPQLDHSKGWEAAALAWTFTFVIYYWVRLDEQDLAKKAIVIKTLALVLFLVMIPLTVYAGFIMLYRPLRAQGLHLLLVSIIATLILALDLWMGMKATAIVADAPMLVGFVVLLFFVWGHRHCQEDPNLLISGAIAFELLVSNVLFVIVEWGVLEHVTKNIKA